MNSVLIPFNMLYDTEMGLIKLIADKYMDPEEFQDGLLLQPDGINKYFLKQRIDKNPLTDYVLKEGDTEYYYNEFMEKKYSEVLQYSPKTGIYSMIEKFINQENAISVTIICSDEKEMDIINRDFDDGPIQCISPDDYEQEIDLRLYDSIYVKDINDLFLFGDSLDGKNIYMATYMHNYTFGLEEPIPDVRVVTLLLDKAELYEIDIYPDEEYIRSVG